MQHCWTDIYHKPPSDVQFFVSGKAIRSVETDTDRISNHMTVYMHQLDISWPDHSNLGLDDDIIGLSYLVRAKFKTFTKMEDDQHDFEFLIF